MTEPLIHSPQRLRWRRSAIAFTVWLLASLGGETMARAETPQDVAAPANAVLARLEAREERDVGR